MATASEAELRRFMASIRQVESGGEADPYLAQGFAEHPEWGRAQGAYQIMSNIIPEFAAKAGYDDLTVEQFLANPQGSGRDRRRRDAGVVRRVRRLASPAARAAIRHHDRDARGSLGDRD